MTPDGIPVMSGGSPQLSSCTRWSGTSLHMIDNDPLLSSKPASTYLCEFRFLFPLYFYFSVFLTVGTLLSFKYGVGKGKGKLCVLCFCVSCFVLCCLFCGCVFSVRVFCVKSLKKLKLKKKKKKSKKFEKYLLVFVLGLIMPCLDV